MRFHQLLLEFDLTKTLANFGERILDKLEYDRSFNTTLDMEAIPRFTDAKAHTITRGYGYHHKKYEGFVRKLKATIAIEKFMAADPTANKKYTQWICQKYVDFADGIRSGEDLTRVHNALTEFETLKNSGYFRRDPQQAPFADINRFKGLTELEQFLAALPKDADASKAYLDRKAMTEATVLYDDAKYKIVVPKTQAAATAYGRNTKWCTTSENGDKFDYYLKHYGPLYIIIDKPKNRRWQFCFEAGQFMDETDKPIYWDWFPEEIWGLIKWPWQQLASTFVVEMLATGTPPMIANIHATYSQFLAGAIMAKDDERQKLICDRMKTTITAMPDMTWKFHGATLYKFKEAAVAFAFDLKRFKMSAIWSNPAVYKIMSGLDRIKLPIRYEIAASRMHDLGKPFILDIPDEKRLYIFRSFREGAKGIAISFGRIKDDTCFVTMEEAARNIAKNQTPYAGIVAHPAWKDILELFENGELK